MQNKLICLTSAICLSISISAQGTWTALRDTAPALNNGVMILLTDGSVMITTTNDPNAVVDDTCGPVWNRLTPDSTGSYVNGKWSPMASMLQPRNYFSSQVLQNGKVYVAGGEYGTGGKGAELYDPVSDTWSAIQGILSNNDLSDANSQMLPDGRVLQNIVSSELGVGVKNIIYNPDSNNFSSAYPCPMSDDESSWLRLPDYSILYEAIGSVAIYRYIPSLNEWKPDAPSPVSLYDHYGLETGAAFMLPDGRAFFLGSNGNTAYYTPSGDTSDGHWALGPVIPNGNGTPDAPAAMMADGHILCAVAQVPNDTAVDSIYHPIMYFYDFDYSTNTFTRLPAPDGQGSVNRPSYSSIMLDLPDGNVLLGLVASNQYYIYTPGNPSLVSGKPTISKIDQSGCGYMITGTLFNGISQGAAYGDDWQMATNYPIVRLISGGRAYYARTTNWNRTGIMTGSLLDTAYFTLPSAVPNGNYSLLLSANGISSDSFSFSYVSCHTGMDAIDVSNLELKAIPNPAHSQTELTFTTDKTGDYIIFIMDIFGRDIVTKQGRAIQGTNSYTLDFSGMTKGIYIAMLEKGGQRYMVKIVVE